MDGYRDTGIQSDKSDRSRTRKRRIFIWVTYFGVSGGCRRSVQAVGVGCRDRHVFFLVSVRKKHTRGTPGASPGLIILMCTFNANG